MKDLEKTDNSAPVINDKITLNDYKCFKSCTCFDRIMPINIIIGKNNSGKSSLIELIEFINCPSSRFLSTGRDGNSAEIYVERELTKEQALKLFTDESPTLKEVNTYLCNYLYDEHNDAVASLDAINLKGIQNGLDVRIGGRFLRITAERDIGPETVTKEDVLIEEGGRNVTRIMGKIITDSTSPISRDVIEIELLNDLNSIMKPDIEFTKIELQTISYPKSSNDPEWEIFFVDKHLNRVRLSRMGSGIKTVLLVLLNLITTPLMFKNEERFIFAFEELENYLHPALQRRLFEYIKKYSEKYGCYFFLTTHSNVVIDVFGAYEHAQIIHVENDGKRSTTKTVLHDKHSKKILRDLGVKASDLLQSNGIIWVEGPSDRNYLNKWIELLGHDLQEGLHYSIMFYGGDLRSNLTFDENWVKKNLIPMLKINTNAYIVMDRDGKNEEAKLNKSKQRIIDEIKEKNCWVTKGREIENYLSDDVIKNWLSNNYEIKLDNFSNGINIKLENSISTEENGVKFKYNSSKTVYSYQIAEYIDESSLEVLDLKEKLDELIKCIIEWNE